METKTEKEASKKILFNRGNPDSPAHQNRTSDNDLSEEEREEAVEDQEEMDRKQLFEEQREREIERSYEEEDESNKKDWARF